MSKLPTLRPSLLDYLTEQKRGAKRQANTSAFARSGTRVSAEDVTEVSGQMQSADFDGDLAAGDAGTTGWALNAARAAFGALFLRPGSIENDSLVSPVKPQAVYIEAQNFALSYTSAGTFVSLTVTVPAGFTSAVVSLVGRLFAINPNAGADYLSGVTKIDGIGGDSVPLLVGPSGGSGHNVSAFSRVLPGLTPGGTFILALLGNSNIADWAANASNVAEVSGTIFWFR